LSRRNKAVVFIAFLWILLILGIIIPIFWGKYNKPHKSSPPGKYIKVGVFCTETGDPVPDGLAVRCVGPYGYDVIGKTSKGYAFFGSGVADGTYTISWTWCGKLWTYDVTIDCSKLTWVFDYKVPNPTITKHFLYDTEWGEFPPVIGLNVILLENGEPIATKTTDGTGTVVFGGDLVEVCKNYTLRYTWGGTTYTIPSPPIHFAYTEDGKLMVCSWEETNYLDPKGGGDKSSDSLTLADQFGFPY